MAKVLLAGESWISSTTEYKGFDSFTSTKLEIGCEDFLRALRSHGHEVTHVRAHDVQQHFPWTVEELNRYDVVILSDIGSNSFALSNQVFMGGVPTANRMEVLAQWVSQGHGLMMAGGYLSFAGFEGKAHYHGTAIERALPVEIAPYDDRVECPQGVRMRKTAEDPIVADVGEATPPILGYQKLTPDKGSRVLLKAGDDPVLITGNYGEGRSVAFASDISPHWASKEFMQWDGYGALFSRCVCWLAQAAQ